MYSFTRAWTECQEPITTTTVSSAESRTNQSEIPSTPMIVADAEARRARALLDQLEAGLRRVEIAQTSSDSRKVSERGPQRHAAAVAGDDLRRRRACSRMKHHPDQRQEGDEREQRPVAHDRHPSVTIEVPADQRRDADQHDEGIVVDVAGLQPHHPLGARPAWSCATPSGPKRSMIADVAAAPEAVAERLGRPDEQEVVELVEVPLVVEQAY